MAESSSSDLYRPMFDELKKINWSESTRLPDWLNKSYFGSDQAIKYFEENSYSLGLINSCYISYPKKPIELPQRNEAGLGTSACKGPEEVKDVDKFDTPALYANVLYPKPSVLTKQEQTNLYFFLLRFEYNNKPLLLEEKRKYAEITEKAKPEQVEFQEFIQDLWHRGNYLRCQEIHPEVKGYIDHLWQEKIKRVFEYPATYRLIERIPLIYNDNIEEYPVEMKHCKLLYRTHNIPSFLRPAKNKRTDLVTNYEEMVLNKPLDHMSGTGVSEDCYAYKLVATADVDVVISASGLKTLIDNQFPTFNKEWNLPVSVEQVKKTDGSFKNVVFIDKTLPPESLSQSERSQWHSKLAARMVLNPTRWKPGTHCEKETKTSNTGIEDLECFGIPFKTMKLNPNPKIWQNSISPGGDHKSRVKSKSLSDRDLQTFDLSAGICELEIAPIKQDNHNRRLSCDKNMFDDDDGRLVISEGNEVPKQNDNVAKEENKITNITTDLESSLLVSQKTTKSMEAIPPMSTTADKPRPILVASHKKATKPGVAYNLWKLDRESHSNLVKTKKREIRVLVRNRIDGIITNLKEPKEVYVSSKLEYQPEYGAEIINKHELARNWMDLYIRPNTHLARVRSIATTREVMMLEVCSLPQLVNQCQTVHNLHPHTMLGSLYAVLTKLIGLSVGRYLLNHTQKQGAFADLMKADTKSEEFNLHAKYYFSTDQVAEPTARTFLPIDCNVLTPSHHVLNRPPGLFNPVLLTWNQTRLLKKKCLPDLQSLESCSRKKKKKQPGKKTRKSHK